MKEKLKKYLTFKFIIPSLFTASSFAFGIISLYYIITEFNSILEEEHILFIPFAIYVSLSTIITSFLAQDSIEKRLII